MRGPSVTRVPAGPERPVTPHDVALWCAEQGWPVHPLATGRKTPVGNCAACKDQHHQPAECACLPAGRPCHGFHAATTNAARIDAWWSRTPAWGVGIACGGADLIVIDIDAHSAPVPDRNRLLPGIAIHDSVDLQGLASGFDTLALLAALRRQPSPAADDSTLRVRTPSGGLHVWYRNPHPATRFRCSTGSSSKVALAWQVDVRADGGYIVAPTTRTAQGTYLREGPTRLPAPLPEWLGEELVRTGHVIQRPTARPQTKLPEPAAPAGPPRGTGSWTRCFMRWLSAQPRVKAQPLPRSSTRPPTRPEDSPQPGISTNTPHGPCCSRQPKLHALGRVPATNASSTTPSLPGPPARSASKDAHE